MLRPPVAGEAAAPARKSRRVKIAAACAIIFLIATGVRLLHWQDSVLAEGLGSLTHRYLKHGKEILDGGGMLFPRDFNDPANAQLLVHPPGYPIFVAAIFGLFGQQEGALTLAQILVDGAAVVMVALIAAELFPLTAAVLSGLIAAFSPHLSHYSLFLLPDSPAALPILVAIYLLIIARKRPRLLLIIAAGVSIGISCWLRSNALLLPLFIAAAVWFLFQKGKRARYFVAFVVAAAVTILPITVRNFVVFGEFIPLSLGAGITLIEGIADYDKEGRFGMPQTDRETKLKDVEWHDRADYGYGLWKPDGIYRDRYRFSRGLAVARSNPAWFAGVMMRRAAFMLRYNSATSEGWPFDTARVPPVSLEASFGHRLQPSYDSEPAWVNAPDQLKAGGKQLARQSDISVSADAQALEVAGDASGFGDQFASAPIPVEENTDYVFRVPARLVGGQMAAKVTSADRRIVLASAFITGPGEGSEPKTTDDEDEAGDDSEADSLRSNDEETGEAQRTSMPVIEMPFATGGRAEVLLVVSNNGEWPVRSTSQIGEARLYRIGPTPHVWTRLVRPPVRAIQRNLYTTSRLLPLVLMGVVLLAAAGRKGALLMLLVVPIYYLCMQSAFHTEYRYIIAIHYFLFVTAGVTLYCAGALVGRATRSLFLRLRQYRAGL